MAKKRTVKVKKGQKSGGRGRLIIYALIGVVVLAVFGASDTDDEDAAATEEPLPTQIVVESTNTPEPTLAPTETSTTTATATLTVTAVEQVAVAQGVTEAPTITPSATITVTPSPTITDTPPPTATTIPSNTPIPEPTDTPAPAVTEVSLTTYYVLNVANARECARIDNAACPVAVQWTGGQAINVTGQVQGDDFSGSTLWYRADHNGQDVYVHSALVTMSPPVSQSTGGSTGSGSGSSGGEPPPDPPPAGVECPDLSATCSQLTCEQAYACLRAGKSSLDRDKDGVPCESVCPGG